MPRLILAWVLALCCGGLLLFGSGCVTEQKGPRLPFSSPAGGSPLDELNVLAIPVALNFDGVPGPDGFFIKIHPNNKKRPKSFPITAGQIAVLMYDGIPGVTPGAPLEPRRVWTYSAQELRQFEIQTGIGTAYQLALRWEEDKPSSNKITVLVRYTFPDGTNLSSAPTVISVAL